MITEITLTNTENGKKTEIVLDSPEAVEILDDLVGTSPRYTSEKKTVEI